MTESVKFNGVNVLAKWAKKKFQQYGEIQLEYFGYLVAKVHGKKFPGYVVDSGEVKASCTLPSKFCEIYIPREYEKMDEQHQLSPQQHEMVRLINAISAEVGHKPVHRQYNDVMWKLFW